MADQRRDQVGVRAYRSRAGRAVVLNRDEQFSRVAGRINLPLMSGRRVVIVGVGAVGSIMAGQLASSGVGQLRLIDGDHLGQHNLIRHQLPAQYVGMNKAEGLALYLDENVSGIAVEALPRNIDESLSDSMLDRLLADADLIVAATDDDNAQRRVGTRALALGISAVFPALYADGGGEVFVQLRPGMPCFRCWDGFREDSEQLRGVTALGAEVLAVIQLATELSLALLDPHLVFRQHLISEENPDVPQQLFVLNYILEGWSRPPVEHRPDCPSCSVGPALFDPDPVPAAGSGGHDAALPDPRVIDDAELRAAVDAYEQLVFRELQELAARALGEPPREFLFYMPHIGWERTNDPDVIARASMVRRIPLDTPKLSERLANHAFPSSRNQAHRAQHTRAVASRVPNI